MDIKDTNHDSKKNLKTAITHSSSNSPILLYNTQNMDAEQLTKGFSIRKKEYQRIWQDVLTGDMNNPETHYLIQGVRGAGKTTILSRLAYDVASDEQLKTWLIAVLFNEEEHGVYSLFTFWLRVAEKLADSRSECYQTLYQQINKNKTDDAEIAWQSIANALDQQQHKIIVLVDNMAEMFDGFDDIEHAQLREVLSLSPHIRLIGASSVIWESHFDNLAPFYQFFKLVTLKPIDEANMHALLRSLAEQTSTEAIQRIEAVISEQPERIEAVRRLTDGVPRTIVLLFQIIMEGTKDSSYAYLEETIDKTTPLYQHRMADLSRQQRVIVHAIAMNWDAMNAKEIAEVTRLPSKTISAQLAKLQKDWIIDKIPTNTKNHLYIIKERFFNIWYLMRCGNQDDRRVLWLSRFLDAWCDKKELEDRLKAVNSDVARFNPDYINALFASKKLTYQTKLYYFNMVKEMYPNILHIEKVDDIFPIEKNSSNLLLSVVQNSIPIDSDSQMLLTLISLLSLYLVKGYDKNADSDRYAMDMLGKLLESANITVIEYYFDLIILFLAQNRTEFVYDLMNTQYQKEEFKPLYYATVSLLPDGRNQEYLRMGSELQSTVDEILQRIEEYRERYS